jgi:AbiU2
VADLSAEEVKKRNIEKMGEPLGTQFTALWNELAILYLYWGEYTELFGTKPSRIELMNQAAPAFFHMLQEELWESRLLHIARIADASATGGKTNLTRRNLPELIPDAAAKAKVTALVDAAICPPSSHFF